MLSSAVGLPDQSNQILNFMEEIVNIVVLLQPEIRSIMLQITGQLRMDDGIVVQFQLPREMLW